MSVSNNFPTIKPSLNLDFANTGVLDPRVTFARASTATYYDGVTTAKAEENLVTYSQEFDNAAWAKSGSTITANTTAAPDGTTTADTSTANGSTAVHDLASQALTTVTSSVYVASIFLKAGTNNYAQICVSGDGTLYANFDLSSGIVGTTGGSVTASIVNVGSGWYRCIFVYTAIGTVQYPIFTMVNSASAARRLSWTAAGTETVYLWGAQLEQRSAVSSYTPTTTQPIVNYIPVLQTAAANVARFDHNPTTSEALGLLIEEQRTNLLTYSSDFSNAVWVKPNATITADTIVAPDGTLTGDKLVGNVGTVWIYSAQTVSITSPNSYTQSVFAKYSESQYLQLQFGVGGFGANVYANFDLINGTVTATSGVTATISAVGNGWYRCAITAAATATVSTYGSICTIVPSPISAAGATYTGNGYKGIYIWGAQLEDKAFPTSYIPTPSNSQVTRQADAASMTGTNFSSWYNAGAGTFVSSADNFALNTSQYVYAATDGSSSNIIYSRLTASGTDSAVQVSSVAQAYQSLTISRVVGQPIVAARAYEANYFLFAANGNLSTLDTTGTTPVLSTLWLGATNNTGFLNGHLRKLSYYPQRLSNANLQALTS